MILLSCTEDVHRIYNYCRCRNRNHFAGEHIWKTEQLFPAHATSLRFHFKPLITENAQTNVYKSLIFQLTLKSLKLLYDHLKHFNHECVTWRSLLFWSDETCQVRESCLLKKRHVFSFQFIFWNSKQSYILTASLLDIFRIWTSKKKRNFNNSHIKYCHMDW